MSQYNPAENRDDILNALYQGDVTLDDAYRQLSEPPTPRLKRARFVRISIKLPNESRGINTLMQVLFALPIPIGFAKLFLKQAKKKAQTVIEKQAKKSIDLEDETALEDVNTKITEQTEQLKQLDEMYQLLRYAKGTRVFIDTNDAKIRIKI